MIIDSKVVLRELYGPTDLAEAETLTIYKLIEVVIVSKDKDLMFAAFQIMVSSLKDFNDS